MTIEAAKKHHKYKILLLQFRYKQVVDLYHFIYTNKLY